MSDELSDDGHEHRRTYEDVGGLSPQVSGDKTAGHDIVMVAWGSRGRRFKSCRPDRK
jgi:hypothetical protein